MGKIHLHNSLHLRNARLTAVSDISEKSLLTAKKAGVKHAFRDYNDLLKDPKIDAVIISLPTFLHAEVAIKAAEHGKHILVEKPLARNVREAERVVSAANLKGVKLMVGYTARFNPLFQKLKNEIKLGTLGDVQIATANHIGTGPFFHRSEKSIPKPVPSWWFDMELTGGGALLDLGSHLINLLIWYFGKVVDAKSYLGYKFNMDFEDYAIGLMEFENGPIATIKTSWGSKDSQLCLQVCGSAKNSLVRIEPTSLSLLFNLFKAKLGKFDHNLFYRELDHFVSCLQSDIPPEPSGEEGLKDLKVISMMYRNASRLT